VRYYIVISYFCNKGKLIAEELGIPTRQYRDILRKFNAFKYKEEYYFYTKEDAAKCIAHLEEIFGVINKLMEE